MSRSTAPPRRRMSRRAKAGIVVATVALTPVAVTAIPAGADAIAQRANVVTCSVEELPLPEGVRSAGVRGADPTGRYLTGTAYVNDSGHEYPLLWRNDKVFRLGVPDTWYDAVPRDVNDSGVVIGTSGPTSNQAGWVHADGSYSMLAGPAGADEIVPRSINAAGDIVGSARDIDTSPDTITALMWSADDPGTYRELSAPDGAWATRISETGVVLGKVRSGGAHIWSDVDSDATPLATRGHDDTRGVDLSGNWVVGWTADKDSASRVSVIWNIERDTVRSKGDGPLGAVNVEGDVIDLAGATPMVIRSDETLAELPALTDGERATAQALFDPGSGFTAAGESGYDGGGVRPVRWSGC